MKWIEIHNQVREAMHGPQALPFDKALSYVLCFRRPTRFYIDHERAVRLLRPHITRTVTLG